MAGIVLVPSEPIKGETSDVEDRIGDKAERSAEIEGQSGTDTSDSQSGSEFGGLQTVLGDGRADHGAAKVRSLDLSRLSDKPSLFRELADLLSFDHHRVRSECSGMIIRIIRGTIGGDELDLCMSIVLPSLVQNLGHSVATVRESAASCLVVYMKHTHNMQIALQNVITYGLLHEDVSKRREITKHLHLLFEPELADKDWHQLLKCLLFVVVHHESIKDEALEALLNLKAMIGGEQFQTFLQNMDAQDRLTAGQFLNAHILSACDSGISPAPYFQFVHPAIIEMLLDKSDWKARVQGIEELKFIVRHISDVSLLVDELPQFLSFLADLLNDVNFKVTLITLEIYGVIIDKLKWQVKPLLKKIVDTLVLHLGENKVVIRAQSSKVLQNLMHTTGPSSVVAQLCANLSNTPERQLSTKTREEILNVVILALLTFPSYEFEPCSVCQAVAPALLDPKRRIRQACLECLAVLNQAMGPSKLSIIASAIDAVAEPQDTEAALAAVLARLARRQLPRVTAEGHVEYSLRVASGRNGIRMAQTHSGILAGLPQGADIDWIVAGSGSLGSGSARNTVRMTSNKDVFANASSGNAGGQTVMDKVQPASFPSSPATPRRIVSPGHGKVGIPWEGTRDMVKTGESDSFVRNDPLKTQIPGLPKGDWFPPVTSVSTPTHQPKKATEESVTLKSGPAWTEPTPDLEYRKSGDSSNSAQTLHNSANSYGMLYSNKSVVDRINSRPMEKVAAMLGNNILPSKLRPVADSGKVIGSTIVPLPSAPFTPSSTWPGNGTLPALPQKAKVLSPILDFRDAPVPTRPTLVRSSSGNRRSRVPPIGQLPSHGPSVQGAKSGESSQSQQEGRISPHLGQSPKYSSRSFHDAPRRSEELSPPPKSISVVPHPSKAKSYTAPSHALLTRRAASPVHKSSRVLVVDLAERSPNQKEKVNPDFDDDEALIHDYFGERGSVDSGVESIVRPRSRSPSLLERRRPRSLDLHTNFAVEQRQGADRERHVGKHAVDRGRSPSPLSSESQEWSDDEDIGGCVRERAMSEVSSLSSSTEHIPTELPSKETHLQFGAGGKDPVKQTRNEIAHQNGLRQKGSSRDHPPVRHSPKESGPVRRDGVQGDVSGAASGSPPLKSHCKSVNSRPRSCVHPKPIRTHSAESLCHRTTKTSPTPFHVITNEKASPFCPFFTLPHQAMNSPLIPRCQHASSVRPLPTDSSILNSSSPDAHGRRESISVIGRGMLPQIESSSDSYAGTINSPPHSLNGHSFNSMMNSPEIQGKGYLRRDSVEGGFSTEDEDMNGMSLSQSTFNKMMSKKMEMMKEAERRKLERQQKLQEKRRIWLQEQENKKMDVDDRPKNGQVFMNPKTPPDKPTATRRRPRYGGTPVTNGSSPGVSASPKKSAELSARLMKNPEEALRTALSSMERDDWNAKCDGVKTISALSHHHPEILANNIHDVNLALIAEVKNLRSSVSRSAIQCFGDLFVALKKGMESDLEMICKILLHKSGESNVFIKEDVEKSLLRMVENVTPQKAAMALILGGAGHRNAAVRKTTAQFLALVCEMLGPAKIMSGSKDVTDRIIPTAAQFVMDGSPQTRYYGRKIFFMLLPHSDFDRIIRQYIQPNTIRNIQDILEGLKTKGLGSIPNESASSRHLKGTK